MLDQSLIDRIDAVPVQDVLEHFGNLQFRGLKALCPFHEERTPSFAIHPASNTWRCYGCGRAGGTVQFLMSQGRTWLEAMEAIAELGGIDLPPQGPISPQQEERIRRRNQLQAVAIITQDVCVEALCHPQSPRAQEALAYCAQRFGDPNSPYTPAHTFRLGYWPGDLYDQLIQRGYTPEMIQAAGLADEQTARRGGLLSGRLIIPIHDHAGKPVGFAGRYLGKGDAPKYINTRTSDIYRRRELLFGYHLARHAARQADHLYLVEGYADLMRLHALRVANVVAVMGTQLTEEQVLAIQQLAERVTILPDTDRAGAKAALDWGWALFERGTHVQIARLASSPEGAKADPDTALRSLADLESLPREDFPTHAAALQWVPIPESDTYERAHFARRMQQALSAFDDTYTHLTARNLDALDHGTYWREALRKRAEPQPQQHLTQAQGQEFLQRYGFVMRDGRMLAPDRSGKKLVHIANFTVTPLFYIRAASGDGHTRLLRITNTDGHVRVLTLRSDSDGLFSAFKFRNCVSREGNYTYKGTEAAFVGLLEYIHQASKPCQAIQRLGWDPEHGFWVWANGIYHQGAFHRFEGSGVTQIGDQYYHFDARASVGAGVDDFLHRQAAQPIPIAEWIRRMYRVFGKHGVLAVLYVIATLNRDAVTHFGPLPILNACGPRGAGKSMLANSIMRLFFQEFTLPNLHSSTVASMTATLTAYSHVPIGLDEYSNTIGTQKIELLKSIYDGGGRLKMGDNGRAINAQIRCGVLMCGQHVAESDVALFSRLIYMDFQRTHYTREDEDALRELQDLERKGLTHLVHHLVDLRDQVAAAFPDAYLKARPQMEAILRTQASENVISRTVHIWTVLLATFMATEGLIAWPFRVHDILAMLRDLINSQRDELMGSDDIANFWSLFIYLTGIGVLREDIDFRVEKRTFVTVDAKATRHTFEEPTRILQIDISNMLGRYSEYGRRMFGENAPLTQTIRTALRKSVGYISCYHKSRLCVANHRGEIEMDHTTDPPKPKRRVRSVYSFRLDAMPLDMQNLSTGLDGVTAVEEWDRYDEEVERIFSSKPEPVAESGPDALHPFDYE